jgi:SanA protein
MWFIKLRLPKILIRRRRRVKKKLSLPRRIFRILLNFFALTVLGSLAINAWIILWAGKYVYTDMDKIPSRTAIMVLGSQTRGKTLSTVLRDRVTGGIRLVQAGKGSKLLLSGDHGQHYYDEVNAMRLYVLANAPDIAEDAIFMDHAGFSTWDSMYRARDVFEVKDLLIVTQGFHISRAVAMARSLGIDAVGYAVDEGKFSGRTLQAWKTREYFARVKAFLSIVFKPKPKYLGEKIPITGDGRSTWI